MKNNWQTKKLGEVIVENKKSTLKSKGNNNGDYPFFVSGYNVKSVDKYLIDGSNIYLPTGGNFFVHYFDGKASYSTDTWSIKTVKDIDIKYLYYFLVENQDFISKKLFKGATIKHLQKEDFRNIEIPFPSVEEQKRIVKKLDMVFEKVTKAKENTEKNLQNSKELFGSYLQSSFNSEEIPRMPIGSVADVFDGPHATPSTVDSGPVFLGIGALENGKINLTKTRHVSDDIFKQWTRRVKPSVNDIVFSYETRLGQAGLIPEGLECCLGRRMGLVRVNPKQLYPSYFLYQYVSPQFQEFLKSKTIKGATVDRISIRDFPSFKIQVPSLTEQKYIINKLDALSIEMEKLENNYGQKLSDLGELKKSILNKAFIQSL